MNSVKAALGEVITFYSYKGGTGRTMALANVGCLLANNVNPGEQILMVDWDLEAPGLHQYFRSDSSRARDAAADDRSETGPPGLIEVFVKIEEGSRDLGLAEKAAVPAKVKELLETIQPEKYAVETGIKNLKLLRAGTLDESYSKAVATFDWEELFRRSPQLITGFADHLARHYRYVLIDSRTGLTDTSGICTALMPEKLVVVFTPNQQSLTGIRRLITRALEHRAKSRDARPLSVFPLASRIEADRVQLEKLWRLGDRTYGSPIRGYQPVFERIFSEVYGLPNCNLEEYFNEVKIQQTRDFAYGEQIAVLKEAEAGVDRFSLTRSYQTFTERLINLSGPWMQLDGSGLEIRPIRAPTQSFFSWLSEMFSKHGTAGLFAACLVIGLGSQIDSKKAIKELDAVNSRLAQSQQKLSQAEVKLTEAFKDKQSAEEQVKLFSDSAKQGAQAQEALVKAQGDLETTKKNLSALQATFDQLQAKDNEIKQSIDQITALDIQQLSDAPPGQIRNGQTGYIWIGTWSNNVWNPVNLADPKTKLAIEVSPSIEDTLHITAGDEFIVRASMSLRDAAPQAGPVYYRNTKSLGAVPQGKKIVAQGSPMLINRLGRNQYWLLVEVGGNSAVQSNTPAPRRPSTSN